MNPAAQQAWNEGAARANAAYQQQRRRYTIDPITRLEGHGKIDIFLNDKGDVDRAYMQVPELRGFEVFSIGRPAEDMPQITSRICGVCPTAHHMAATKALDDLYKVTPTSAGRKIRELVYNAFMLEDHALHVYVLGGPDFIVGPQAPAAERNIVGVIQKVGLEVGKKVISMRRRVREIISYFGGKVVHPVLGLPGGVSKALDSADLPKFQELAKDSLEFALFTNQVFHDIVLKNSDYVKLITSPDFTHKTYYMGMVDEKNRLNFYDGLLRVVDPTGKEYAKFPVQQYRDYVAEHVEPWSYMKFCYLKPLGWQGFDEGPKSSIYAVAPLARLNASDSMATPQAQKAAEEYFKTLGGKPVHHTLANHWARIVEMIQAAERILELVNDPEITSKDIRLVPTQKPSLGIGVVEAPRGTLFHQYETDDRGIITRANMIVATQNNAARIAMSVERAAKGLIKGGQVSEGLLNMVEMAFRAYDPCLGCATHSLPGHLPLAVNLYNPERQLLRQLIQK
ncbi:MAG TPA: Ni/Fe hydrogenase subunit alpha [Candidatus Paceibacterota bacterium]|nr:Ni/Fe hydrogenase subunit alpha [Verrucomicrobiota bacterium]HRY50821.1 Ni/Fe hydrogenase subunit alpha [Candidatus Paceibacterota bacterium]